MSRYEDARCFACRETSQDNECRRLCLRSGQLNPRLHRSKCNEWALLGDDEDVVWQWFDPPVNHAERFSEEEKRRSTNRIR